MWSTNIVFSCLLCCILCTGATRDHNQREPPSGAQDGYRGDEDEYDDADEASFSEGRSGVPGKRRHLTRDSDSPPSPKKSALLMGKVF